MSNKKIRILVGVAILALIVPVTIFFSQSQQTLQQHAATGSLLPGEQIWKNGVSSYIFGTNNTELWGADNIETDTGVQKALAVAHVSLIRTWMFDCATADSCTTPDGIRYDSTTEEERRLKTDENIGAKCLGVLPDINNLTYDQQVVSYAGNRCVMWEFGNEPDLGAGMTNYINQWNTIIPQLRKIAPNDLFIGPVVSNVSNVQVFLNGVKSSGVLPDAVSWHEYPCWNEAQAACLQTTQTIYTNDINSVRQEIQTILAKTLPIGITEWNADPGDNYMKTLMADPAFLQSFYSSAFSQMVQGKLDFADQFTAANFAGYGALDMFDTQNQGKPLPQWTPFSNIISQYYQGSSPISNSPSITSLPTPTLVPTSTPMPTPTLSLSSSPTGISCITPTITSIPTPTQVITPTQSPLPSGVTYCGVSCLTNADCDTSGVTCGICDPNTNVCVGGQTTGTPVPTNPVTLSPSPLPTASPTLGPAVGTISVHFEGIDPQNNQRPLHLQRMITLSFYQTVDFTKPHAVQLLVPVSMAQSDPNGSFVNAAIDLSAISQGSYYVLVKSLEGSLQEEVNNTQPITIAKGQTISFNGSTNTNPVMLRMGDLDNDNQVTLSDYNILIDCYGVKVTSPACASHHASDKTTGLFADINDDGNVDGIDYNILMRHFGEIGFGQTIPNSNSQPQVIKSVFSVYDTNPCVTSGPTVTAQPTVSPSPVGHFSTLPPGSQLPSDAQCAAEVRKMPENRPDNTTKNNVNEYALGVRPGHAMSLLDQYDPAFEARVTGNFTGTTDEILQWAACKWGFDEDIVRAQAQQESNWHQSQLGDSASQTQPGLNGHPSVGILQVKGGDIPPTHPGTWPYSWDSTAWNIDYSFAVRRACFEGKFTWLGGGLNDIWGCVGEWYSGHLTGADSYIASVKTHYANKDWLKPGF